MRLLFIKENILLRAIRRLSVPVSESSLSIAVALAAVAMSLMLWAILWQSDVISYQRDLIRWLWSAKYGG
jgi:hypothetical protein